MLEQISRKLKDLKQIRLTIQSVWLFRFIVFIGLAPFTLALFLWVFALVTGLHDEWLFKMIDAALRIGNQVLGPAVVSGLLNIVPRVTDSNGDGIPDLDEKEEKTDEKSNSGRHPDDG